MADDVNQTRHRGWHFRRLTRMELLLWPTFAYITLLLLLQLGDLDHTLASLFTDPGHQGFPLRHAYLTEFLLHDIAQGTMKGLVALLLIGWLASWPITRLARWRRPLGYLVVTALISVALVNLGKGMSNMDCPWSLEDFGGQRAYYNLFEAKPADAPAGHCFPGGHSSSGFALFGLFFLGRRLRPSRAIAGLLPALVLGGIFAVNQWARGAHFPSHDLTTAYLCWLVALAGDYWILGRQSAAGDRKPAQQSPRR